MKRVLHSLMLVALCLSTTLTYGAHIFFDFNGVLGINKTLASFWEVGPTSFIDNPFRLVGIKKTVFHFLSTIEPRTEATPLGYHEGIILPQIFCDWQTGKKTHAQITAQITAHMETPRAKRFFKKYGCKKAVTAMCNFMFDAERFATTVDVIEAGVKLLKTCKAAGHKVYILSNYSKEAFECLPRYNEDIRNLLALCDGICISGELGLMKPDPDMYLAAFEQCHVDADNEVTVFFDDELVNVTAAQRLGKKKLYAAHVPKKKYDQAYALLKELDLI